MVNAKINATIRSFRGREWKLKNDQINPLTSLQAQLKLTRSNKTPFLPPPILGIKGSEQFITQILNAIRNKTKIGIFGDYDADGICSTVMWIKFFNKLGVPHIWYIPNRQDGYGPSETGINNLIKEDAKALLFLDCGTNSIELDSFDIPIFILDHHRIQSTPQKALIVNCHSADNSDYSIFCTSGLTIMMIWQLLDKLGLDRSFLSSIIDLACIGTIGDVMPLASFNKTIVKAGIEKMNKGLACPGILALIQTVCRGSITASTIAFNIVPCINAPGRVSNAAIAVNALLSDRNNSIKAALELEALNQLRRQMEKTLFSEAITQVDDKKNVIIVKSPDWHAGIVGIIAGRLKEEYAKTSFALYKSSNLWRGSARGSNVSSLIETSIEMNLAAGGGGHKAAGGICIKEQQLDKWIKWIENLEVEKDDQSLEIDAIINPRQLLSGFSDIKQFAPFGHANPAPRVLILGLIIKYVVIYKNEHLRLTFDSGASAIAFRCAKSWGANFKVGMFCDIVFSIEECGMVKIEDGRLSELGA